MKFPAKADAEKLQYLSSALLFSPDPLSFICSPLLLLLIPLPAAPLSLTLPLLSSLPLLLCSALLLCSHLLLGSHSPLVCQICPVAPEA